ncbi:DUF6702 family protein [Zooshikella harenae]|uniref:Uncharacterized protein n=1 Tax=Zooshikella harenae TaxID=2827238 RepID=A0ABS5Z773_9GAMM|nr:DUF6702 family protein [Zooshikella harenae]MBU2709783.1 hypothetical protein [Zooshikella harenae]
MPSILFVKSLLLGLFLFSQLAYSHTSFISFYNIILKSGFGYIYGSFSQQGVDIALGSYYGKARYSELNIKEKEKLLSRYLLDNISIKVGGEKIVLNVNNVRFGNHETNVDINMLNVLKKVNELDVKITAMSEIRNQQNVVVLKFENKKEKMILSRKNDFKYKVLGETSGMMK